MGLYGNDFFEGWKSCEIVELCNGCEFNQLFIIFIEFEW